MQPKRTAPQSELDGLDPPASPEGYEAPAVDLNPYIKLVGQVRDYQSKAAPTYTVWDTCGRVLNGEKASTTTPAQVNYNVALPSDPTGIQQAMFNKLLEPYRTIQAKLGINIPYAGAMPATDSPDDVAKAQAAEALLSYWMQQQKFDRKMNVGLGWLLQTGNVGLYLCQYDTETRLEIISPYNYFFEPDLNDPDDTRWVVVRRYATKAELVEMFPEHREALEAVPTSVGPTMGSPTGSYGAQSTAGNSQPGDRVEYWEYVNKDGTFAYLLPEPVVLLHESTLPPSAWPFACIRYTAISGRVHGKGIIEPAIEAQRFYNLIRTAQLRNATLTGNPKVLVHNMDPMASGDWTDRPGQVIKWGGDGDLNIPAPAYLQPPSIPAYVQNLPAEMLSEVLDSMGVHATSLGKRQANVSSGRAIEALTENDASQLAVTMQAIEFAVQHIASNALIFMQAYMPEKTMIRQLDRWGAPVFRELRTTDLGSQTPEIFIDADSLFRSRMADRRAMILSDMQMGILTPEEAKEKLRSRTASMPDLSYMADLRHAKEVLEAVTALQAPAKFYKRDNLEIMERVFGEFMRSPAYYQLPPATQDLLDQQYEAITALMAPQGTAMAPQAMPIPQADTDAPMPTDPATEALLDAQAGPENIEAGV
jgi:CheY-like chemotaxis protein